VLVAAVLILITIVGLLIFAPNAMPFVRDNVQNLFIISAALALIAAVLGFFSWRTPQGKIAGIGGTILSASLAILLSATLITSVERQEGAALLHAIRPYL
jgi:hypothetical protein